MIPFLLAFQSWSLILSGVFYSFLFTKLISFIKRYTEIQGVVESCLNTLSLPSSLAHVDQDP